MIYDIMILIYFDNTSILRGIYTKSKKLIFA